MNKGTKGGGEGKGWLDHKKMETRSTRSSVGRWRKKVLIRE